MNRKSFRALALFIVLLALAAAACDVSDQEGPPRNAAVVNIVANTSLGKWLTQAADSYNAAENETTDGKQIYVELTLIESGQAVADITAGEVLPTLWVPEEQVWINLLAEQGNSEFQGDCQSVASSPLVIAMWRPVAESLGWPGLPLGWLDIGSLAADPSAWNYYSGGLFGDSLRLGHTHPGLSGSGASTLLAIVQAAQSKTEAVTTEEIAQPIVEASVSAFEAAVATFSTGTAELGNTMADRGVQYLGAGIMYENNVVEQGNLDLVPIYPLEGTFVANHPACISQQAEDEIGEAATLFRDYLVSSEAQELAVASGLRPVNESVTPGPPLDEAHGVDLEQPTVVFNQPTVDAVGAVQTLWQSARKDVNLVMLLDVSGSMDGDKIENMLEAAVQFVNQMGEEDKITILTFSHELNLVARNEPVGPSREQIVSAIERLEAGGDTALYDAIGAGAMIIGQTTARSATNAMVVLTDGQDTYSFNYSFDQNLIDLAAENDTTVFTIAYGRDADDEILSQLAYGAQGNFYLGDEASIAAIYQEMSAAFGGSVGVGR